jgi:hypothetical protein
METESVLFIVVDLLRLGFKGSRGKEANRVFHSQCGFHLIFSATE